MAGIDQGWNDDVNGDSNGEIDGNGAAWVTLVDPATGYPYDYCRSTGESKWQTDVVASPVHGEEKAL